MAKIYIEIKIEKSDVFTEVRRMAAYVGKYSEDGGGQYDNVSLNKAQEESLDGFYDLGCTTLTDVFRPYIEDVISNEDGDYNVVLAMPTNFNELLGSDIQKNARTYLISLICSMWFRISKDDGGASGQTETRWVEDAAACIAQLRHKIYDRQRPRKQ